MRRLWLSTDYPERIGHLTLVTAHPRGHPLAVTGQRAPGSGHPLAVATGRIGPGVYYPYLMLYPIIQDIVRVVLGLGRATILPVPPATRLGRGIDQNVDARRVDGQGGGEDLTGRSRGVGPRLGVVTVSVRAVADAVVATAIGAGPRLVVPP